MSYVKPKAPRGGRQGFQVRLQILGFKNKFFDTETAKTFDEARAEARELYEGRWALRIECYDTGEIQQDFEFDNDWEET